MTDFQPRSHSSNTATLETKPIIVARDVEKWYDNGFHVLKGVSTTINQGEVVVLMGPSGSGKSTFIRTFNGLEPYQKGSIEIDGTANRSQPKRYRITTSRSGNGISAV